MSKTRRRPNITVRTPANSTDDKQPVPATQATASISATLPTSMMIPGLTGKDSDLLSQNENFRYLGNSKKVGHAVIKRRPDGQEMAVQYAIPPGGDAETPEFRPLQDIEAIERYGLHRYQAKTPGGTVMYAARFLDAEVGAEHPEAMRVALFSPRRDKEPFWGSDKTIPLWRTDLSPHHQREFEAELKEIPEQTKGGPDQVVEPGSVKYRDEHKTRNPDQNTVMGESARDAYEHFMDKMTEELTPEAREIFQRAVDAPLRNMFKSQYRPEWLHAYGYSLTPQKNNPQLNTNLGAAPKWANTEMMVLERIAKWFALNRPETLIKIKPFFTMLLDSELIKNLKFAVTLEEKGRFVRFLQELDPFKKYPLFRKATDLTQGTAVALGLLHDVTPVREQLVIDHTAHTAATAPVAAAVPVTAAVNTRAATRAQTTARRQRTTVGGATAATNAPVSQPVVTAASTGAAGIAAVPLPQSTLPSAAMQSVPQQRTEAQPPLAMPFPTHLVFQNSIVQTATTSSEYDYDEPWRGISLAVSHGTGVVIAHAGKKYVLTNAHCVENGSFVQVRLANSRKQFKARPICVSYQCDLALLEVNYPLFQQQAVPVELGEMVSLQESVKVMGFPMGGEEISVSDGIVSRIEVREYCMSGEDMLQVQVSAAINPGNSGGPVFSGNKVVGISFQGYDRQGLGFMIPMPVIDHFLGDALSGKPYQGFPVLPVEMQPLENRWQRESYGMQKNQTGVRVKRIDTLCDAHNKLKPDDILLTIDGLPIANDGRVNIPGVGNCIDLIHVTHMKHLGETVRLQVLRRQSPTEEPSILTLDVLMDSVPHSTEMVLAAEHDKVPTYFMVSGLVFQPLTRNYLESNGTDLEEHYQADAGCYLPDIPRKSPDDQFVVLTNVLDCSFTDGYGSLSNEIVKTVNGKEVHNFREFIEAIESNTGPSHTITTAGKDRIVIKRLSPEEEKRLLKKYHLHHDRSDDLRPPSAAELLASGNSNDSDDNDESPQGPIQEASGHVANQQPTVDNKAQPMAEDDDDNDSEATEAMEVDNDETQSSAHEDVPSITRAMLPGLRRYAGVIANMEQRYQKMDALEERYEKATGEVVPYASSDDDDYNADSEESESSDEEDQEQQQPVQSHRAAAGNSNHKHRLFHPKPQPVHEGGQPHHKRRIESSDDESVNQPAQKKPRTGDIRSYFGKRPPQSSAATQLDEPQIKRRRLG